MAKNAENRDFGEIRDFLAEIPAAKINSPRKYLEDATILQKQTRYGKPRPIGGGIQKKIVPNGSVLLDKMSGEILQFY